MGCDLGPLEESVVYYFQNWRREGWREGRSQRQNVVALLKQRIGSIGAFSFGGVRSCGKWEVEPEVVFSQVVRHVQDERLQLGSICFVCSQTQHKGQCWIASQT